MLQYILTTAFIIYTFSASLAFAHPGHAHPKDLRISRSTHKNMQSMVPEYLAIADALANGAFDQSTKKAAEKIAKEAGSAEENESERTGRKMYRKILAGAKEIQKAGNLAKAREGFANLNSGIIPFFHTWTGHLDEHGLTMFECKDGRAGWMQKGTQAKDPYRGINGEKCPDLKQFQYK